MKYTDNDIFNLKDKIKTFTFDQNYIEAFEKHLSVDISSSKEVNEIVEKFNELEQLKKIYPKNDKDTYREMFISISNDISVILLKFMEEEYLLERNKTDKSFDNQQNAEYILNVYVPILSRLGLYDYKSKVEDLILYITDYENYMLIAKMLKEKKEIRDKKISKMISEIQTLVEMNDYKIYGRSKHIYSIYQKMVNKDKEMDNLFDLFALRIITDDVNACYQILGEIHQKFEPLENRFKDYIAKPKANLYQSIHTVVKNENGDLFEIQIRTKQMHEIAELGVAAHFTYKEKKKSKTLLDELKNYRITNDDTEIKKIYDMKVYALTPDNKIIKLQKGSTVIDFAYAVHTNVGNTMVGAVVNDKIKPFSYEIKTKDIVSIITKKNSSGPSIEWVDICTTVHAKRKIRNYLNKKDFIGQQIAIENGTLALKKELEKNNINLDILNNTKVVNRLLKEYGYSQLSSLYNDINEKKVLAKDIVKVYIDSINKKETEFKISSHKHKLSNNKVIVSGASGIKTSLAKCCHPVYGDEIVAIVKQGVALKVHRANCNEISEKETLLAKWNDTMNNHDKYLAVIKINIEKNKNSTNELIIEISKMKIEIVALSKTMTDKYDIIHLKINVETKEQLDIVQANIYKCKNVISVTRS